MGIVYLAALILGLGIIGLQLLSGSSDADADAGADLEAEAEAELDADADSELGAGELDHGGHGHAKDFDGAAGALALFLSLRFWTFGLTAFGLSGAVLHFLELTSLSSVPYIALAMGLASGLLASWTFRALSRGTSSSGAASDDAIGSVGRVLVPVSKESRGKIRIELRGQSLDYLATTDDPELEANSLVVITEVEDGQVRVTRAPDEFLRR